MRMGQNLIWTAVVIKRRNLDTERCIQKKDDVKTHGENEHVTKVMHYKPKNNKDCQQTSQTRGGKG